MNFLNKCLSLALSLASRGVTNNKVSVDAKRLRGLSCFGNADIIACPHLLKSTKHNSHYCGACGCGDSKYTQLTLNGKKYSKLDYPFLSCPLEMPGFSNYCPASPKEVYENSRKAQIELYDIIKLNSISVSNPMPSKAEFEIFDKIAKVKNEDKPK